MISQFEPRLSRLRVVPERSEDGVETHVLAFRIEAELWGQPVPQLLILRTSIDVDSGDVSIAERGQLIRKLTPEGLRGLLSELLGRGDTGGFRKAAAFLPLLLVLHG